MVDEFESIWECPDAQQHFHCIVHVHLEQPCVAEAKELNGWLWSIQVRRPTGGPFLLRSRTVAPPPPAAFDTIQKQPQVVDVNKSTLSGHVVQAMPRLHLGPVARVVSTNPQS